jgi:hypothetical protein
MNNEIKEAEARANVKMRRIADLLLIRAEKAGHREAIEVCKRFLSGDDSAGDDIQQGMRDWGL